MWIETISIIIAIVVVIFAICFIIATKAHKLRVRDPLRDSNYIQDFLMIETIDKKTGALLWTSVPWQKKIRLEKPPLECIDVGKKGKLYAEVYKLTNDEYAYIQDNGFEADKGNVIKSFQPLSTTSRSTLAQQIKKAEEGKQHNFLKENAMNLAALGFMTMIIVMGFVYWGEISKSILDKESQSANILKESRILLNDLGKVSQEVTAVKNDGIVTNSEEPPTREEG